MTAKTALRLYVIFLAAVLALFTSYAVYNTVMNNYFQIGATTWDSAEFSTIIWRSGWTLQLPAVFGKNQSFFGFHASWVQLIPNLFSYAFPGDRLTYYAVVYGVLYSAMVIAAFRIMYEALPGWSGALLAALCAIALFASQPMIGGSWEMRVDYASPLFVLLGLRAYQLRRYNMALLWLLLNAGVREDLGIVFAIPLAALALAQWLHLRKEDAALARERLTKGAALVFLSVSCAVLFYLVQIHLFRVFNELNAHYYPLSHPFSHITPELMRQRAQSIFATKTGVWMPLAVLALGACVLKDAAVFAGAIGFIPYLLAMFFAKDAYVGILDSYRPFPLVVALMWPALVALARPSALKRRYMVLQVMALAAGLSYISAPDAQALYMRWTPQPFTENREIYRKFGELMLPKEEPMSDHTRASDSIIALYPYQFPLWWKSNIGMLKPKRFGEVNTLIWFDGDRDGEKVQGLLDSGNFALSIVPGTHIVIARRILDPNAAPINEREVSIEPVP